MAIFSSTLKLHQLLEEFGFNANGAPPLFQGNAVFWHSEDDGAGSGEHHLYLALKVNAYEHSRRSGT